MKKFSALMKKIGWVIIRNWPMKLVSLFLAICLWAGLITQDDTLTRERSFTDVTITVNGADTLQRNNGLIVVSGLDEESLNVRMRVNVPQSQYNNVTASTYNPRIDLSKITETGEQTVKIQTTFSSTYGNVTYLMPDTVTVMVEEYVTNYRIPVVVRSTGSLPEGWYGSSPSTDPTSVTVSGPKSVVDQIARVCVDYSLNDMPLRSGRFRSARSFTFENESGDPIESDQIEVTSENILLRSIIINQMLYASKTVPVSPDGAVTGEPAEGYRIKKITLHPDEVTIAADPDALNAVQEVFIDNPLSVNNISEDLTGNVRLKKTSDIVNLSTDTVTVTVQLEPVMTSRFFNSLKVQVFGLGSEQSAVLSDKSIRLMMTGPQNVLKAMRTSDITAYIQTDGLEDGEYSLPVQFAIEGADMSNVTFLSTPKDIRLKLTSK